MNRLFLVAVLFGYVATTAVAGTVPWALRARDLAERAVGENSSVWNDDSCRTPLLAVRLTSAEAFSFPFVRIKNSRLDGGFCGAIGWAEPPVSTFGIAGQPAPPPASLSGYSLVTQHIRLQI